MLFFSIIVTLSQSHCVSTVGAFFEPNTVLGKPNPAHDMSIPHYICRVSCSSWSTTFKHGELQNGVSGFVWMDGY